MANIGDWLRRTEKPLEGKQPFDWHDFSVAQVVQKEEDYVKVEFACNCMTFDHSNTKKWYNGEYKLLNQTMLSDKLDAHALHCPFKQELVAHSFSNEDTIL